jgi:uncharacterized Tic20 family protein
MSDSNSAPLPPSVPHDSTAAPGEPYTPPPAAAASSAPYGQTTFVPRPVTGALSFALGFLSFIFIPLFNLVVAGIVMAIVGYQQSKRGGLASVNGRAAANWGLTMIVIMVPAIALWVTALSIRAEGFFPWGISIIVWGLLAIANLVVIIIGLVRATSGREARIPAIPFLR